MDVTTANADPMNHMQQMKHKKHVQQRLRVATYNIRNTTDRYDERRPLLEDVLAGLLSCHRHHEEDIDLPCDILAVQEVRFEADEKFVDQVSELFSNKYTDVDVFRTRLEIPFTKLNEDPSFRIDGNCIVCNTDTVEVLSHSSLVLSPVRNAQRVVFRVKATNPSSVVAEATSSSKYNAHETNTGGCSPPPIKGLYSFTNVHLHHELGLQHEKIRFEQVQRTVEWICALDTDEMVNVSILGGDFNARPDEPAYDFIVNKCGFVSGYAACNYSSLYAEPERTFPTGLKALTMDTDPPITCDYIFIKEHLVEGAPQVCVELVSASLFGGTCDKEDSGLLPSDHFGVEVTLLA
jgi:endonuclease/exonuclease/phosphatase family metal-dependent hydrolase